jgi:hypothetical protein
MTVIINNAVAGLSDSDHTVKTGAKVMVNDDTLFTVTGSIQILSLVSECVTANNSTASTLLWKFTTVAAVPLTTNLSGASSSLANTVSGYAVVLATSSSLGEAPNQGASGVLLNTPQRGVRVPSGALKITIAAGSTTGTWRHYIRYEPLEDGAYAVANQ